MTPDLQTELIRTVLAIATPVLVTLVTALLYKALKKAGLDLSAEKQAQLEYCVRQAILRAEEWGASRVKAQLPTTPTMKLEKALSDVVDKVPGITRTEAEQLIHAELPKIGAGAARFVGAVRSAATTEPAR